MVGSLISSTQPQQTAITQGKASKKNTGYTEESRNRNRKNVEHCRTSYRPHNDLRHRVKLIGSGWNICIEEFPTKRFAEIREYRGMNAEDIKSA